MNKMDRILMALAFMIVAFIITMIVIFCVKGSVPDTLITCTLGGGIAELVCTMLIKVSNIKKGENNGEVEE